MQVIKVKNKNAIVLNSYAKNRTTFVSRIPGTLVKIKEQDKNKEMAVSFIAPRRGRGGVTYVVLLDNGTKQIGPVLLTTAAHARFDTLIPAVGLYTILVTFIGENQVYSRVETERNMFTVPMEDEIDEEVEEDEESEKEDDGNPEDEQEIEEEKEPESRQSQFQRFLRERLM